MGERDLVFVKPGHLKESFSILNFLDAELIAKYSFNFSDFSRRETVFIHPLRKDIEEHYKKFRDFCFFESTIDTYVKKGMVLTIYSSEREIIGSVKKIIGDKDPLNARSNTIRGIFGTDSLEEAFREKRYCANVIHSSYNKIEAEREINIWEKYF